MDITFLTNLLGGIGSLVIGVVILLKTVSDSRRGYNGFLGSHIKLYVSSIAFILLGLTLIYRWLF